MRATWNGVVNAESDDRVLVEGKHYFRTNSLRDDVLRRSASTTMCGWEGRASYFSAKVDGKIAEDAVWFWPEPLPGAEQITGRFHTPQASPTPPFADRPNSRFVSSGLAGILHLGLASDYRLRRRWAR